MSEASSPLAAFRHPVFTVVWTATLISNVGVWMYGAASAWLMTSLNSDPLIVSLVQAASSAPVFLFALPAGAFADIFDKRKYLIVIELLTTIVSALYAAIVWLGYANPVNLLLFTFLISSVWALSGPAWQAVVPQLVPKDDLPAAITANSVGVNLSRALGPALGGAAIAGLGIVAPFWINAASNLFVNGTLLWWRPQRTGRWKLQAGTGIDLTPSMHWPAPVVAQSIEQDRGPVLVTVEYRIRPQDRDAFLEALEPVGAERRRDGAYRWGVFEDTAEPGRMVEIFLVESWMEHLRQHERVTNADRLVQECVQRFQMSDAPKVTHYIAAEN